MAPKNRPQRPGSPPPVPAPGAANRRKPNRPNRPNPNHGGGGSKKPKPITDPATEDRPLERLVAIRALFSKVFDFRGAAERVLGPEWRTRTAVEQREFT